MKTLQLLLSAILSMQLVGITRAAPLETVFVGNPGNEPDKNYGAGQLGKVSYTYWIGKFEVTNSQYTDFLNAADPSGANTLELYEARMQEHSLGGILFDTGAPNGAKYSVKSGRGQNPVVFVNWFDAARFCNWLHNGKGGPGTTEQGAYTLLGGGPIPTNWGAIVRNPGARWFLPSEDEWYKAAYHQPSAQGGDVDDYWLFPMRNNTNPFSDQPPGGDAPQQAHTGNFAKDDGVANGYDDGYAVTGSTLFDGDQNYLTDVGAYTASSSFYGTFDQGGNVWEWLETPLFPGSSNSVLRGGYWDTTVDFFSTSAARRANELASFEWWGTGFRVAQVPEPHSIILAALAFCGVVGFACRWRKQAAH